MTYIPLVLTALITVLVITGPTMLIAMETHHSRVQMAAGIAFFGAIVALMLSLLGLLWYMAIASIGR